jgi:hypothetical protein
MPKENTWVGTHKQRTILPLVPTTLQFQEHLTAALAIESKHQRVAMTWHGFGQFVELAPGVSFHLSSGVNPPYLQTLSA